MLLIRFFHYLGLAMWVGGWIAGLVFNSFAKGSEADVRTSIAVAMARVQTVVVMPGVILTIVSGILWSLAMVGPDGVDARVSSLGLGIMTAAGFLGGLLNAFVVLPAAAKLRATAVPTADGTLHPVFYRLNNRLVSISNIAGILALVSLFAAVLAPPIS